MSNEISLAVVTPGRIMFEGVVSSIQIPAADGYMGFLPQHAPLISPLGTGIIQCTTRNGETLYFCVSGGYFEVHENRMVILADVAEEGNDVDLSRAEEARDRARSRLKDSKSWDIERARASLTRSLNRIRACELSSGKAAWEN